MRIIKVRSKQHMKSFVRLPELLHGESACFVPPIWMGENKAYYGKNNPILINSDYELFLLLDERGTPIGRTIAYIDFNHNKYYNTDIGFFGAFECIDDKKAGELLVAVAEDWLRSKGMHTIRGPIHPVAENWGFLFEDYDTPPIFMSPWNPEYYHNFFTIAGYTKAKDLLVYEADMGKGYEIPKRFDGFMERYLKRNPGISIRRINMKNVRKDAKAILDISNEALANNWGFVPLELSVMEDLLKKLKLIVDTDAVWMVEDKGKVVGYCLGFPDINILLKKINGNLLPFGFIKLLLGLKYCATTAFTGLPSFRATKGRRWTR